MTLRDYVAAVRARWGLTLLCTGLGVALALLATATAERTYEATTQLFVSASSADSSNVTGLNQGGQFAQQRVKSYADIVESAEVMTAVVDELDLADTPRQLADRVHAAAPLGTVLINVTVQDRSTAQAQLIANAVAERFTEVVTELERPVGGATAPVKVSVVRAVDRPEIPVSPNAGLNLALGLLLGLGFGVVAAVVRDAMDTSLKSVAGVQDALGLGTLGVLAYDPGSAKRPLVVLSDPQSPQAEAFRQLRTNLQFADVDHPPRSMVVTSSLPSEGKSTSTCNLAVALTQLGMRVVLVEGDLRRPRLAQYLGIEGAVGLTDVLVGRADLADVLQPWGDGLLEVLPSGATPPNPSELLGSEQMRSLLRELEGRADLVLIDAPPVLPVTDASVLATLVSGVLLVVKAGATTREQAARATSILRSVDSRVYGVVLSMAPAKGPDSNAYGYGYANVAPSSGRHLAPGQQAAQWA